MKYIFLTVLFLSIISISNAQKTYSKKNNQPDNKQTITVSTNTVTAEDVKKKVIKEEEKQSDEYSQSEVLVDNMSNDNISYTENEDAQQEYTDPDALPYTYGQIKGVMNIEGKNILVLESEDGSINLIYVYNDKGKMKWKLYGKIKRIY